MSPELLQSIAAEVYGLDLLRARAEALAAEQNRMAAALWSAAPALDFDTPPWSHRTSAAPPDEAGSVAADD